MPNWGPNFCIERSIQNDNKGVHWLDREDSHCYHGARCCWCGRKITLSASDPNIKHGKFAPRSKKSKEAPPDEEFRIDLEHIK